MGLNLLTSSQLDKELLTHMTTDYTGSEINLAKQFGIEGKEWRLIPGNILALLGPTGGGKSALCQQIVKEAGIPTLVASLEVSPTQMYRRDIQQLTGMTKQEVQNAILNNTLPDLSRYTDHVHYVDTYSLDMPSIVDLIKTYDGQFKVLVLDHIKLINGAVDTFARLGEITRELKMLALKHNIIIIEISQVSNTVARHNTWDAVSGSGNGSIGQDADMVMAIVGDNTRPERVIKLLQNRDGDHVPDFNAKMNDAFQIVRTAPTHTLGF